MKLFKRICKNCNILFIPDNKYKQNVVYCSKRCRDISNLKRAKKRYRILNKGLKSDKYNLIMCIECLQKFKPIQINQKYCSHICRKKHFKNKVYNKESNQYYKLRFDIFKRDNFKCVYCGKNPNDDNIKLHIDHIKPKSKTGLLVKDNLITSCSECNLGKRDILLEIHQISKFNNIIINRNKKGI